MDPSKIKEKIDRFRILVIGRANAGKTTILQRVCNTRENPEIFNSAGEKIDATVLAASRERGDHDIENELVFRNNPGFIFHDSCGFEAGGKSEYEKMSTFIADRSKRRDIKDRIHTIWYCIPLDEESRSFTQAEVKFFSHCDTGSIPVIVVFTKFDALYDVEFGQLTENGASRKDARELAPKHAKESFANGPQLRYLYNSKDIRWPPKCHVCLPDMDKDNADCGPLIKCTAGTLDNEVLQQLFISAQQTNLELCVTYAVEKTLRKFIASAETIIFEDAIGRLGAWFPHIRAGVDYWFDGLSGIVWDDYVGVKENLGVTPSETDNLGSSQRAEMRSRLLSASSGSSPLENIVQLSSIAVIIFEHSFYIFDKRHYLRDQQKSVPSFYVALEQYMVSPRAAAVRQAVSTAVQAYEEAVSTASSRTREATQERMTEFIKRILEITLQYRLPRP